MTLPQDQRKVGLTTRSTVAHPTDVVTEAREWVRSRVEAGLTPEPLPCELGESVPLRSFFALEAEPDIVAFTFSGGVIASAYDHRRCEKPCPEGCVGEYWLGGGSSPLDDDHGDQIAAEGEAQDREDRQTIVSILEDA